MMRNIVISFMLLMSFADADFIRDDAKEIVTDSENCLMWQDNNASKIVKKKWSEAIEYCEELTFGGYDDWRLPNINELGSIIDRNRYNLAIQNSFENVVSNYYWSSTTHANRTGYAWIVYFSYNGQYDIHRYYKGNYYYIRCVRAGQ